MLLLLHAGLVHAEMFFLVGRGWVMINFLGFKGGAYLQVGG